MQMYIFYVRDKNVKIFSKNELTEDEKKHLKVEGFKKHHIEVKATSKKDAALKLNENTNENLKALSNFSGDYFYSILFLMFAFGIAYIFL